MIEQAQQAEAAGDHARALDLATRASRIQMTTSIRLFIAQEQRQVGAMGPAFGNADLCVHEAERDLALHDRTNILEQCRALSRELRQQIGFISVRVPTGGIPGLHVRIAGDEVGEELWGVPNVVSPGTVVIDATADGQQPLHREVQVAAGATVDVPIEMVRASTVAPVAVVTTAPQTGGTTSHSNGSIAGPVAVLGVGVVGLGLAGLFFGLGRMTVDGCMNGNDGRVYCDSDVSRSSQLAYYTRNDIGASVSLAVGGVAVVAGAVWLALRGGSRNAENRAQAAWSVSPTMGGAQLNLGGTF